MDQYGLFLEMLISQTPENNQGLEVGVELVSMREGYSLTKDGEYEQKIKKK